MEEKHVENKLTLKASTLGLYGLGGMFPAGFVLAITGAYFLIFMTDMLGLDPILAATIYSAIQWWKMLSMVASGMVIDGIPLRNSRYRGWCLIAGIVQAIFLPIAFADFGLPPVAAAILVFVSQAILMLGYNVAWTALRTIPAKMAKTSQDITMMNVVSTIAGVLPSLLWGALAGILLAIPLWKGTTNQYAGACVFVSVILAAGGFVMYRLAAPYDTAADSLYNAKPAEGQKSKGIGLGAMVRSLKGPMIPYFIASVLINGQQGFFQPLLAYFCQYVIGNADLTAIVVMLQGVLTLLGSFIVPLFTRRMTKQDALFFSQVVTLGCLVVLAFFGYNPVVFLVLRCIMFAVGAIPNITLFAVPLDIGDYMEMNGEPAPRALLTSIGGTTVRLGNAISASAAAFALAAIGYKSGVTFTPEMGQSLNLLMIIPPAIMAAAAAVLMKYFYRVDERAIDAYRAQRAEKSTEN